MTEKDLRWNKFIEEVCCRDISTLSPVQRKAVLCFWYDSEMNSGGYSGYLDNHPETDPDELERAIIEVANKEIAANYRKAVNVADDDWSDTDSAYYKFSPSLCDYLEQYVESNRDSIFD